jgi:cyclopropane-fatty-acyl-phospholipid synthase
MASYLPSAITQPLVRGSDLFRGAIGGVTWRPALTVSKAAVTSMLSRIEIGQLIITDQTTGQTTSYGQNISKEHSKMSNGVNGVNGTKKSGGVKRVELVVKRDAFWVRLFLFADMGFAESYMLGDFECSDLTGFFEVGYSFRHPSNMILTCIALHPQSDPIG